MTVDRATWRYFRAAAASPRAARRPWSPAWSAATPDSPPSARTPAAPCPPGCDAACASFGTATPPGCCGPRAIVAGLLVTAAGYVSAHALSRLSGGRARRSPGAGRGPAPVRVLTVELSEGVPDVPDTGGPADTRYAAAQVLVRLHGQPLGLVEVALPAGGLTAPALTAAIRSRLVRGDRRAPAARRPAHARPPRRRAGPGDRRPRRRVVSVPPTGGGAAPFVSVVVPTCGRTPLLESALDSLAALDYPDYEIVVVDNAPQVTDTARIVARRAADDPRFRYTAEPRPGVAHARNRGLAEARGAIVAYADDDVILDRGWLRSLVDGFTDDVAAVTGQVLARELDTPSQIWLEQYGGYGKGCQRRRFDRAGITTLEAGAAPSGGSSTAIAAPVPARLVRLRHQHGVPHGRAAPAGRLRSAAAQRGGHRRAAARRAGRTGAGVRAGGHCLAHAPT